MHSYFPPGTAVHTRGGGLSPWFAHLIHCVGPYSIQSVEAKLNTIALVYRSALMTVGTLKLRRIMIVPCLWEFALSKLEFSPGAPHLDDEPRFALDDVVFLCRDKEVFDAFQETKRALLGGAYEKASDDGDTMSIDEVADDL
ncbi:hypothetical protein H310_07841 [Aphanomyces invadans]|uniref:Macro domain-containing protein n=1 Tax=Aphanomyces invadans TaxID=157072 RepID=A0A024U056_9STRA|nr:hypothetical protein H310_07841 [Aphanomyces invadans]ETV99795.1 hypothetical protein H310_07841 [Aphanomyces invadans]|eukprot:XP_008871571.1 hypothetical protein H310_07841 [Aphanomyces invadans]